MSEVNFTEQALSDLERIFQFLEQEVPEFAIAAGEEIVDATTILQRHPLIGRPAPHNLRELVISKGRSGYVALYRFLPAKDRIDILAIRHQRECGFID
ncbi:MAG: type II toxin-antitoxin system RelE/ParE family toxin [Gallionellaceae bacterium]|jgi:addiction module RelE/StbE family toxin|nr:type II toxin-antitoxin system RelE/ParE family toxin [Gallionellaceae bacterium]